MQRIRFWTEAGGDGFIFTTSVPSLGEFLTHITERPSDFIRTDGDNWVRVSAITLVVEIDD